jgi:hypothetical protein
MRNRGLGLRWRSKRNPSHQRLSIGSVQGWRQELITRADLRCVRRGIKVVEGQPVDCNHSVKLIVKILAWRHKFPRLRKAMPCPDRQSEKPVNRRTWEPGTARRSFATHIEDGGDPAITMEHKKLGPTLSTLMPSRRKTDRWGRFTKTRWEVFGTSSVQQCKPEYHKRLVVGLFSIKFPLQSRVRFRFRFLTLFHTLRQHLRRQGGGGGWGLPGRDDGSDRLRILDFPPSAATRPRGALRAAPHVSRTMHAVHAVLCEAGFDE